MNLTGNTILITGGGSGIGRGLAEEFHRRGNKVIIAGRHRAALDEVTRANPGMAAAELDIENPAAIQTFAAKLIAEHPALNVVIHNAGIMRNERVLGSKFKLDDAEATVATNLLGPIRLNAALLPHLAKQTSAAIWTVTSGLAYMPLAMTPTYCATKAAIHSYTESLRYQLKDTAIQVYELIPPYVRTGLMGDRQASDPNAMGLEEFIAEVMQILTRSPDVKEIAVERVKMQRTAPMSPSYETIFTQFNERLRAARKDEWEQLK